MSWPPASRHDLLALAAASALASVGCGGDGEARCANVALDGPILVLEQDQDRRAAGLGRLDENGCLEDVTDPDLGQDPVLSDAHGRPFVVARDMGSAKQIGAEALEIVRSIPAHAPGEDPPNPHDVDVDPVTGRVWITRYDLTSIANVSGGQLGTVELGAHADPDGLPEMEAVRVEGRMVAVSLQLLDREATEEIFPPTGPGRVVLFDADPPHAEIDVIQLVGRNPFGRFVPTGAGELAVATPGEIGVVDALDGIDAVEVEGRKARQLASETFLGGSAMEIAFGGEGEAYAILAGPSPQNATWVVAFDPRSSDAPRILLDARKATKPAFVHSGLAVSGCCAIVGDRTRESPGIWFFDRKSGEEAARLTTPELELPPVALLAQPP